MSLRKFSAPQHILLSFLSLIPHHTYIHHTTARHGRAQF